MVRRAEIPGTQPLRTLRHWREQTRTHLSRTTAQLAAVTAESAQALAWAVADVLGRPGGERQAERQAGDEEQGRRSMVAQPAQPRTTHGAPHGAPHREQHTPHLSGGPSPLQRLADWRQFESEVRGAEQRDQREQQQRGAHRAAHLQSQSQAEQDRAQLLAQTILRATSAEAVRGRAFEELVRTGGLGTARRAARQQGLELRERTLALWFADREPPLPPPDPDHAWVRFESPDPHAAVLSVRTYLEYATYAAGLSLAPLPQWPEVQRVEGMMRRRDPETPPLYAWLYVPANVGADFRRTQVLLRPVDEEEQPMAAFSWACVLALYWLDRERLSGPHSVPQFDWLPNPRRDAKLTPLLHAFARALFRGHPATGVPTCAELGCACPTVDSIVNARPPDHAQATGVLPPRQTPLRATGRPSSPISGPMSGPIDGRRPPVTSHPLEQPQVRPTPAPTFQPTAAPTFQVSTPVTPQLPRTIADGLGEAYRRAVERGDTPPGWRALPKIPFEALIDETLPPTGDLAKRLGAVQPGPMGQPQTWPGDPAPASDDGWGGAGDVEDADDPSDTRDEHQAHQATPPGGWRAREGR